MEVQRTRALVLKTSDHGEADKILTFFSDTLGKVTGIAKGAKRSKKRFVNKLEPFSRLTIYYKPSRAGTLLFISEAELDAAFLVLRQSYPCYCTSAYLCELVLRFTKERDAEKNLYDVLNWAMTALENGERPLKVAALFHIRLLDITGYRPEIDQCGGCGNPLMPRELYSFAPNTGTLLCTQCQPGYQNPANALTVQTLKFLERAQGLNLERLSRLQIPDKGAKVTLQALYRFSCSLLQQDIHSWKPFKALF
ncbi:MAG: DNA repair protein RecO [Desulfobulbus propionicus]|nr:MAG: DNA repair protein RecO [Desulfobulbus propionicus]